MDSQAGPRQRRSPLTLAELRNRREEILAIARGYEATNVRVFGSVARGEADEQSDVDLIVDINTNKRGLAVFGLIEDLERDLAKLLGVRVDVGTGVQAHASKRVSRDITPL